MGLHQGLRDVFISLQLHVQSTRDTEECLSPILISKRRHEAKFKLGLRTKKSHKNSKVQVWVVTQDKRKTGNSDLPSQLVFVQKKQLEILSGIRSGTHSQQELW